MPALDCEPVLTRILTEALKSDDPPLLLPLLAESGRAVHAAAANVLLHTVLLPDDDALFSAPNSPSDGELSLSAHALGPASALIRNIARYAPLVRTLVVVDPTHSHTPKRENTLFELESHVGDEGDGGDGEEDPDAVRSISSAHLEELLSKCTALEELKWVASVPPPDGICETLATYAPHLTRFTFSPHPSATAPILKWDAPSLSHLPPLTHLHLERLSQAGASALAANPPDVKSLALDFVWLDDWVCERIARAPRLRRLVLGTGGTKLTDRGVGALLDGCDALEEFEMVEVQGRLSKTLWANVELPPTLRVLKIALSESGPHHSWTADHLLSFPSLLGLDQLTRISVTRTYPASCGVVDDVAVVRPVPQDVVSALAGCRHVKHLECDWWAWGVDDLKELVEGCVGVQTLRITLDAPFARLLTLTSSFAHLSHLSKLYVTVPTAHAPSVPPSPLLATPGVSPLATVNGYNVGGMGVAIGSPTSSPLSLARSLKSPKLVLPVPLPVPAAAEGDSPGVGSPVTPGVGSLGLGLQSFGAGNTNEQMEVAAVDGVVPPLRDVRKFVRRCPKLVLLEWFGRTARGSWIAHREDAKSVASVKVEYIPPVMTEEDVVGSVVSGVPREGAEWTGPEAEAAAEAAREYEAERDAEIEREKESRRRRPSDARAVAKDLSATRRRGATVSSGVVPEATGKPRRRQSSASEAPGKTKTAGVPPSPCKRSGRRACVSGA